MNNLVRCGSKACLAAALLVNSFAFGAGVVVPNYCTDTQINASGGEFNSVTREQTVYNASEFPATPITITEIRWRPDQDAGGPISTTISNLQIHLSTTKTNADNLSPTFAQNIGADDTVVFNGAFHISTAFITLSNGTTAFDISMPLQTPFTYDPSKGNLLMDFRNFTGCTPNEGNFLNVVGGTDATSRAYAFDPNATNAEVADTGGAVLQIIYTVNSGTSNTAPVITKQPTNQTVSAGGTATFSVIATGSPTLQYQWFGPGTNSVIGGTNPTLTLTNVQPSSAGEYYVVVFNSPGFAQSSNAVLTVNGGTSNTPPVITKQPTNQTVSAGGNATFSVTATGSPTLHYQWYGPGSSFIAGAVNPTLTLSNVQPSQAGSYFAFVTNLFGFAQSSNAVLTVNGGGGGGVPFTNGLVIPNYLATNQNNVPDGTLNEIERAQTVYSASQFPPTPITITEIRWRPDVATGGPLSITISNLQIHLSTTKTNVDNLSATFAQNIGSNDTVVFNGTAHLSTAFTTNSDGTTAFDLSLPLQTPFVYDSTKGNLLVDLRNISGSTPAHGNFVNGTESFTDAVSRAVSLDANAPNALFVDSGGDVLEIIYTSGVISSNTAPVITKQPTNQTVSAGGTATFSVTATGSPTLHYQWYGPGSSLIVGAVNPTLTLSNVQPSNAGSYFVFVTNLFGFAQSSNAVLTVNGGGANTNVITIVQQPTNQTVAVGGTATFSVVATGSPQLEYQWIGPGTNTVVGATNSTLTLNNVQPSAAGSYHVVILNSFGFVSFAISSNAVLTVTGGGGGSNTCTPPPSGLVGWWKGEGNALDSVGINNGVLVNGVGFTTAEVGQGFLFTHTNQNVKIPAYSNLDVGLGGGLTLEAWINPSDISQYNPIFEYNPGDGVTYWGVQLYVIPLSAAAGNQPGNLYADVQGVDDSWHQIWSTGQTVVSNQFQHVALTYDKASGIGRLYYNGTVVAENNLGSFTPKTTGALNIGNRPTDPVDERFTFAGVIDEPSVYNRALSSNEIAAIYSAGASGKCTSTTPNTGPVITKQPTNQTVSAGGTASFFATATGSPTLHYQWYGPGSSLIAGAISPTLTLSNVQPSNAGSYFVFVTNVFGFVQSSNAVLTVTGGGVTNAPPVIIKQPTNQTVSLGGTATFSIIATGSPTLQYQWIGPGTNSVNGGTNSTLTLSNVQPSSAGVYYAVVFNSADYAISSNAVLTVTGGGGGSNTCTPPPSGITAWWPGEGNGNDIVGGNTAFAQPGVNYFAGKVGQAFWLNNSNAYLMAIAASNVNVGAGGSLTVEAWVALTDVKDYHPIVEWNNNSGSVGVHLWVLPFNNQTGVLFANVVGTDGSSHSFTSPAGSITTNGFQHVALTYDQGSGVGTLYVNGSSVAQATLGSFTPQTSYAIWLGHRPGDVVGNITLGSYLGGLLDELSLYRRALSSSEIAAIYNAGTNGKCSGTTSNTAPVITKQPTNQTVSAGGTATFSVTATGSPTLRYQWYGPGSSLIPGAVNPTLTLSNVQSGNAGAYFVFVTNLFGFAQSSNAVLTVNGGGSGGSSNGLVVPNYCTNTQIHASGGEFNSVIREQTVYNASEFPSTPITITEIRWRPDQDAGGPISTTISNLQIHLSTTKTNADNLSGTFAQNIGADDTVVFNGAFHINTAFITLSNGTTAFDISLPLQTPFTYDPSKGNLLMDFRNFTGCTPNEGNFLNVAGGTDATSRAYTFDPNGTTASVTDTGGGVLQIIYTAAATSNTAPVITKQPIGRAVSAGDSTTFSVTATGSPTLHYQWYGPGSSLISGAVNSTLTLSNVQPSNAGAYFVFVTNLFGFVQSSNAVLTVIPSNTCTPPPSGLVAWWKGEGNANDSFDGNNGTANDGVTYANGEVGQAFHFDGTNGFISVPASSNLDVGKGNGFTIEAWINPDHLGPVGAAGLPIVEYDTASAIGVHFWVEANYTLYANIVDTAGQTHSVQTPGGIIYTHQLQHVALTYNKTNGNCWLYWNGAPYALTNFGNITPQTSYPLFLGKRAANGFPGSGSLYNGLLDEVSIYNRELSQSEIFAIIAAGTAGKCTSTSSNTGPVITKQPTNQTVSVGGTATFSVTATGSPTLHYQWSKAGTVISGATSPTLTLSNVQPSNAGSYFVFVTNLFGFAQSSNAVLTVTGGGGGSNTCTPPPSGITAWWPAEGNASEILRSNLTIAQPGVSYAPGEVGQAFLLNSTNAFLLVGGASSNINIGSGGSFTVEAWVKLSDVTGYHPIVEWNDGAGSVGVHMWVLPFNGQTGVLFANVVGTNGDSHSFNTPAGTMVSNVFQHVALTYDQTSGKGTLYVNGNVAAQVNLGIFTPQTDYPLFLGHRPGDLPENATFGAYLGGLLDELSLYRRALGSNEIAAIYTAGSNGKCFGTTPNAAPVITQQPSNQTVSAGGFATFSVAATGSPTLHYQWYGPGSSFIAGAVNPTLTLSNVQPSNAGSYFVLVTNLFGFAQSSNAVLTVTGGGSGSNTCTPPPSGLVGWWKGEGNALDSVGINNGVLVNGVGFTTAEVGQGFLFTHTNQNVKIPAYSNLDVGLGGGLTLEAWINPADISQYRPIMEWNLGDGVNYFGVHLYVIPLGPAFGDQPGNLYADIQGADDGWHQLWSSGQTVVSNKFQHVALTYDKASGIGRLYYNGTVVAENNFGNFTPKTTGFLNIGSRPTSPADEHFTFAGVIDEPSVYNRALSSNEMAAIYNAGASGKCTSTTPNTGPVITKQPTNQTVSVGGTATFSVIATGSPTLHYQWYGPNAPIAIQGAIGSTLTFSNAQPANAGQYFVLVTNAFGTALSGRATLTVTSGSSNAAPVITKQPTNQTVLAGGTTTFSVTATGSPTLHYQWFGPGGLLGGAINPTLTLSNVQPGSAGVYHVTITNLFGSAFSSNAILTVTGGGGTSNICTPPPSGLVAWWKAEGNGLDSAGTNNGTLLGNLGFTNGEVGQAFNFTDTTQGVHVNASPSLAVKNLTIEAWIRPTDVSDFHPIIEYGQDTGPDPVEFLYGWNDPGGSTPGALFGIFRGTNDTTLLINSPGGILPAGQWSHVAMTFNFTNQTGTLYLNGTAVGSSVFTNGIMTPQTSLPIHIGYRPNTSGEGRAGDRLSGGLDEVSIYNRTLSASEIQAIYHAGSSGKCTSDTPLAIITQPTNTTAIVGSTAKLSVTAVGAGVLSYQWFQTNSLVPGATNSTLTFSNVQFSAAGVYHVVVSDSHSSVNSSNATLSVIAPPVATVAVVTTSTTGGATFDLPINLIANGNENALSFTLNFDPAKLTFSAINLGNNATNGLLLPNTSQASNGVIGVQMALPAGVTFNAGTQQVIRVTFGSSVVTSTTQSVATVSFTGVPIAKLLSDAGGNALPANFIAGLVLLSPTQWEGDAAPVSAGNGTVDLFDWVQVGRFVAGLDTITNGNEFQKVDCAPRNTLGDGKLTVADWVQAGRYAAGLDPLTSAGGPTSVAAHSLIAGANDISSPRQIAVQSGSTVKGMTITLPITMVSQGDETALAFSLNFDPKALQYVSAVKGSDTSSANLVVNANQAAGGQVAMVLCLPSVGSHFPAGTLEIAKVTFVALASATNNTVSFADQPVARSISDANATELTANYLGNSVIVNPQPTVGFSHAGNNSVLSWPAWAGDFTLQAAGSLTPPINWTNVPMTLQTNGNNIQVTLPTPDQQIFFRLSHP